jgi:hypothetical protein
MEAVRVKPVNRREFLYYVFAACILLLGTLFIWFLSRSMSYTIPILSKTVALDVEKIPTLGSTVYFPDNHFFLARTDNDALIALDMYVPTLGCVVKWIPYNHRFEEPCRGFKFELDGSHIEGMVRPHDLNRYFMTITFSDGQISRSDEMGSPISIAGRPVTAITIDICHRIEGYSPNPPVTLYSLSGNYARDCF